jgi:hypothetical protein
MPQIVRITIFVIAAIFMAAFFLVLFFYKPVKRYVFRHHMARVFYHKVLVVVRNQDYFFVNDLSLPAGSGQALHIDHVIAGEKFIYVVTDYYFEGAIAPRAFDNYWVYYKKRNRKTLIPNPFNENKAAVELLAMNSGINSSYFVGIVMINDDCFVTPYENTPNAPQLIPVGKLASTIADYEKKDVAPFSSSQLYQAIHDIHDLNMASKEENSN